MAARLQVALLGPVEARVDGAVVALAGVTQRILLARLALSPGHPVPAAELGDLLWPHNPPRGAAGNLQSYLSRLRRVLGADRVIGHAGAYRLDVAPGDVDVGRVEQLVDQARAADPAQAVAALGQALDLWRGEPLGDLAGHLGFAPEVARLAELRVRLLADWLELRLGHGSAADVLPDLERAARAHPMRERLQLLLMRALHRDGRSAEALAVADRYRRRLAEESGLDPGPELAQLQQRILADDADLDAPPGGSRRARRAPRNRFVGRAAELGWLRAAAAAPGLVSVVGPGGVGKTRLAQELLDDLPEPAHAVELGEVSEPGDVPAAIATGVGLHAAPAGLIDSVADRLADEPALVMLDGCEHVLDAATAVVAELLARVPRVRLLVTSRLPLGLAGERVLRLGPLGPDEQVELFCDRASLLRAGFTASGPVRSAVAEVCALVDGLPLGVELAARREGVFGVSQLRERLGAGLEVLEPAGGGDRSTALAATVEWSYRLLAPPARALFDRLAVCRGGFGLDAVEHLAPPGTDNAAAVLASLVDASMVMPDLAIDPPRYRLLEMMRHVGIGHLPPAELNAARAAHARWIHAHLECVHRLQNERSPDAPLLLRRELANLHEALNRLVEAGRFAEAGRLAVLAAVAVSDDPHLDLLAQLRRLDPPPGADAADAALCLVAAGGAAWLHGDSTAAEQLLSTALDRLSPAHTRRWIGRWFRLMARMYAGDADGVATDTIELLHAGQAPAWARATAVCCAALIALFCGDRRAAEAWMAEHDQLLTEVAESDGFIAYTRGELAAELDPTAALSWFDLAVRRCADRGHSYNRQVAAIGRAAVLLRLGRHAEAAAACRVLLDELRGSGMWPQLWTVVRMTAELLVALDEPRPAAALLAAAGRDPLAPALLGPDRSRHARLVARINASGADAVRGALPDGRRAAVAHALAALDRHR